MQNDNPSTLRYCEDTPLAPFSIYLLLSDPSLDYERARKRILGSWTLASLYVDGYKKFVSSRSEIIIIDFKYIRAKREREEIPLKAGKLLILYSIIDESSLPLS